VSSVFNRCHPARLFFPFPSDSVIQLICVAKGTGLGLVIKGGANRADGPMVFIQEIGPGGDCQKVSVLAEHHFNIRGGSRGSIHN